MILYPQLSYREEMINHQGRIWSNLVGFIEGQHYTHTELERRKAKDGDNFNIKDKMWWGIEISLKAGIITKQW